MKSKIAKKCKIIFLILISNYMGLICVQASVVQQPLEKNEKCNRNPSPNYYFYSGREGRKGFDYRDVVGFQLYTKRK